MEPGEKSKPGIVKAMMRDGGCCRPADPAEMSWVRTDSPAIDEFAPCQKVFRVGHGQIPLRPAAGVGLQSALARFCVKLFAKSLEAETMPHTPATIEESHLSDAIGRVSTESERLIVVREGKGIAAVVSLEDLEMLEGAR